MNMDNEKNINMETKDNNVNELEQLRAQLGMFKERLDKQTIISDRMLRDLMHSKIMWMRNVNLYVSIAGLVMLPLIVLILRFMGTSWFPVVAICVMMVAEAVYNFRNIRGMRHLADGDMLETSRRMIRFKRQEQIQMIVEVPLLILWLVWVLCESRFMLNLCVILGGLIGFVVSFFLFRKEMRDINRIVRGIDDYLEP